MIPDPRFLPRIDNIKFEKGPAKHPLTREEAEELGAGTFTMR